MASRYFFPQQGPFPNLSPAGGAVPGAPTPTPDPQAAAQQALGMSKEQMALLTQALQQAATPRWAGGQQPMVPGQQQPMSPTPPAYMTQSRSWGPERFLYGVQSAISELTAAKQERDVRKYTNMYTNMYEAAQKYMKPDGSFDANAAAQDPFLSTLKDSDYKKMADTLQESWLNPKGTGPHQDALKAAQAQFADKQQKRGKLDQFMQGLIRKATAPLRGAPQLTPEQQRAQTAEILGRAPIGAPGSQFQDLAQMAKITGDLQKEQMEQKKLDYQGYRDQQRDILTRWQTTQRDSTQLTLRRLENAAADDREAKRNATTLAAAGIRQDISDEKARISTLNTSISSTLTDLRQQYSRAAAQLKQYKDQESKRNASMFKQWMAEPDVKGAQQDVDNLQDAITLLEKNRGAIISGKMDIDNLLDQVYRTVAGDIDLVPPSLTPSGQAQATPPPASSAPPQFSPNNPFAPR